MKFTVREYVSDSSSGGKFWRVVISDALLITEYGKIAKIDKPSGFGRAQFPASSLGGKTTWTEAANREAKKIKEGYTLKRSYERNEKLDIPAPKVKKIGEQTSSQELPSGFTQDNLWF